MNNLRTFEISVWTLQDTFITVLESAFIKSLGKTQNGKLNLNIDGTQELTFSVPMYYIKNGEKIINPAWKNIHNENIIINTRKVKLILNKKTEDEEVYDFIINKITERHENEEIYCDIECGGLAFFELGKIGYKISLSQEDFYDDDLKWFNKEKDSEGNLLFRKQPIANIQYWLNKFLTKLSNEDDIYNNKINASQWYYTIQMDWSNYYNNVFGKRNPHKIYEDNEKFQINETAIIDRTETNTSVIGEDDYILYDEKTRMVELEESNIYNLTQDIAEIFNVYCKYKYLYNSNYQIIGRIIIFYNSFLYDGNNLNLTYKQQSNSIERTIDSTDLVTKMYVKTVDDTISIIDVEDNYSREDYLLNFDYLHSIKTIDDSTYEYVKEYEEKMHNINTQLKPLSNRIADLERKIIDARAKKTLAFDAIKLDKDNLNANDKALNMMTNYTGVLYATVYKPDSAVLHLQEGYESRYYINLNQKGIKYDTLRIYKTLNTAAAQPTERLLDEITTAKPVYDEFGNLIKLTNIIPNKMTDSIVYLIYAYDPKIYYDKIKDSWIQRLNKDQTDFDNYSAQLEELETSKNSLIERQKVLLEQKQKEIKYFEELMGPALREGYWQPENYSDYGDTHTSLYKVSGNTMFIQGSTKHDYFFWDEELFDGEQDIKYQYGINQIDTYYPCIQLTYIWNRIKDNLDELSFLYYDYIDSENNPHKLSNIKSLSIGSQAIVCFLKYSNSIYPVLILKGFENLDPETLEIIQKYGDCKIGKIVTEINDKKIDYNIYGEIPIVYPFPEMMDVLQENNKGIWLPYIDGGEFKTVYPRICIESLNLKTSEDRLSLTLDDKSINNFEDYILTTRNNLSRTEKYIDDDGVEQYLLNTNYYITLKTNTAAKLLTMSYGHNSFSFSSHKLEVFFTFSNADTAIYRDALNVLKESSVPQVEYSFNFNIFKNNNIIKKPSSYLNHIVKINDYELSFKDVRGYISEVSLDLDFPWNDTVEIKNYKTKFEDLFSTIVAQTEAMKTSDYLLDTVSESFSTDGQLYSEQLQKLLSAGNLLYSFNKGKLLINESEGIIASSDDGVVAFRGDGIFTATEKDSNDNWIWNTGITPAGINGELITAGQLDTSKIRIFSGDKLRFQMNDEGLFAYKSFFEDLNAIYDENFNSDDSNITREEIIERIQTGEDLDSLQYVKFNENGLFLIAKPGAYVLNEDKDNYIVVGGNAENPVFTEPLNNNELERVSISWDGLTLRNYRNEKVFFANADTGDLTLAGTIFAKAGTFGPWSIDDDSIYYNHDTFGASGGIYFGTEGLSFGNLFKIYIDPETQTFQYFSIFNNSEDNDDYFFQIKREDDEEDDTNDNKYSFNLKNVTLEQDIIDSIVACVPSSVYKTTVIDANNIPQFPADAPNGSVGVVYTDTLDNGDTSFSATNVEMDYPLAAGAQDSQRTNKTYFGIKLKYWNVVCSTSEGRAAEWESIYGKWARVGSNSSSSYSGVFAKVLTNSAAVAGTSFTINFKYKTDNNSNWLTMSSSAKRSTGIVVEFYKIDWNTGNYQLYATGNYQVPFSSGNISTTPKDGAVSLTLTRAVSANTDYYIVFYSKNTKSLIYIEQSSIVIGNTRPASTETKAIYLKSLDAWKLLIGSEGLPSYLLPTATSSVLGGIKIGDRLTIDDSGILSADEYILPPATANALGGIMVGSGLTIDNSGILSANQYILPQASSNALGGIKVGTGLTIDANGVLSANEYILPAATSNSLGGIIVGSGLSIDNNNILSANEYILPAASASTLGGIKVGTGLTIDNDDILSTDIYSVSYTPSQATGILLGILNINGVDYPIYMPDGTTPDDDIPGDDTLGGDTPSGDGSDTPGGDTSDEGDENGGDNGDDIIT